MRARICAVALGGFLVGCGSSVPCGDWPQWAHDPAHSGNTCATAQAPNRALATFVFDPFVQHEQWETVSGDLLAHFPTPLLVGDDVYMLVKSGQYVDCQPTLSGPDSADGGYTGTLLDGGPCGAQAWNWEVWNEVHFQWQDGSLVQVWSFQSDWTPVPAFSGGWEPVFQAAVSGDTLFVPGANGTVHRVDRRTGKEVGVVTPAFDAGSSPSPGGGTISPSFFTTGGITVDASGDILYDVLQLDPLDANNDGIGYLVKATPDGKATVVSYSDLVPGAPGPADLCVAPYYEQAAPPPLPWPPLDGGQPEAPPAFQCFPQRAGINVAPAIGSDGTIYSATLSNYDEQYSYLVAITPDLKPKWQVSLRGVLDDGCGVDIPADADADGGLPDGGIDNTHCSIGAPMGVDPWTGLQPAGLVDDTSSSSPMALPDGTAAYGALTNYNNFRGHLFKVGSGGVLATYDFGWDVTPAVWKHDGTYSIITKDNHYFFWDGSPPKYFLTRLDANLKPEWSFQNTDTKSCTREPDGGVDCVSDMPDGFEWCVNAPAIDGKGTVLANSEDGNLYVLGQDGSLQTQFFLNLALGAAYTPVAVDHLGRIYALNGGVLTVLGE